VCVLRPQSRGSVRLASKDPLAAPLIDPAKLALGDLTGSWSAVGPQMIGRWTIAPQPPRSVCLADIREAIDAASETEIVLGLMAGGVPYTVDLDDDSPHIAVSAGTGAGKSVLAMLAAVQILRRGGRVVILDVKGSHRGARGVPGILHCLRPEEMHEALIDLARSGSAVLIISQDLDEIFEIADRVAVISRGHLSEPVPARSLTREQIGLMMAGFGEGKKGGMGEMADAHRA